MKIRYSEIHNVYGIKVKHFEPEIQMKGYILALHGFCGDMESSVIARLAKQMTAHGFAVVAFNFPGHGSSGAHEYFSVHNCRRDMIEVMRYADSCYDVTCPSAIFATSFGGYITLLNMDEIPQEAAIVLRAPAVNMKRSFEKFTDDMEAFRRTGWQVMGFDRKIRVSYSFYNELDKNFILNRDLKRKMLIIHGDSDDIVLPEDMQLFCSNNPKAELDIIIGADHRFKGNGYLRQIIDMAEEYILEVCL